MSDSPAVVLRTAAARVRETARGATRGPWAAEESREHGFRVGTSDGQEWVAWTGAYDDEPDPSRADAAWIALMHPGLAEPLAAWLEETADLHEQNTLPGHANIIPPGCQWCADEDWPCADTRRALAVAHIILGTTKETPS